MAATNRTASALAEAARPANTLLAAIGAAIGALAARHPPDLAAGTLWPFLGVAIVAALGTAGGNLLNDVMDRELDRTAHPRRPLPSGRLARRPAATAAVLLLLAAIGLAFVLSPAAGLLALGLVALLILYETRLKARGLAGNLAVAVAAGALFPLGALAVSGAPAAPLLLGAVAAAAHLGRELLKDAEDSAADVASRRTLAVQHGPAVAARLAVFPLVLAVVSAPLPVPLAGWSPWYLVAILPSLLLFLAAASNALRSPARAQLLAKAAMVLALLGFLAGALL